MFIARFVSLAVSLLLAVGFANKALAQTATNVICNGCVGASDIGTGAVQKR